tara:strand:+ start:70 stop:300 length:231 start_codon:yes stop_codon:yes gene_type:complete
MGIEENTFITTPSFEMGRLIKDIKNKNLEHLTAKTYLKDNVYVNLDKAMSQLLETIERNGEFEKYVMKLANRQEKE